MTAVTAPSPSPAPSTSIPCTPTRSSDAAAPHHPHDGASTSTSRRHDPSTTLGEADAPIDLASPPYSAQWSASPSTLTRTDALPPVPTLGTRVLPPAPIQPGLDRSSSPSKQVRLPTPYKAPRLAQSGVSESFATAYPTQETRQKYASPAKPLLSAPGFTSKRSWQAATTVGDHDVADSANKKAKPSFTTASSPVADVAPTAASSNVTITGVPKPGSSLSNQVSPPDLHPAVSGTDMTAQVKTEYLSLLDKPELIDMVKQLESQLHDLLAAPAGSSTLYRQARIYPAHINVQIDKLRARQRAESAKQQLLAQKSPLSAANLSLKDVYTLLHSKLGTTATRNATPTGVKTSGRPVSTPRRPLGPSIPSGSSPSKASAVTPKPQSLNSLIHSINALVGQQSQPGRGPTGAPLPPAQTRPSSASSASPAMPAGSAAPGSAASLISPAMLKSIVGDGPMPSNAALAAALTAHFGGNLPGRSATSPSHSDSVNPVPSAVQSAIASSNSRPVDGPGKDISAKIAAILGSSSASQTTMLGPQGLPLAPAATGGNMQIGNIAAMLSNLSAPNASQATGASNADSADGTDASNAAFTALLKQLEDAKKATPFQQSTPSAVQDPIAILTGASANPLFTPSYPSTTEASPYREASWSPDPEPVIVQGPQGTSTLPSYEDMIVEGLREKGDSPPRTLFNWMQDTYPLMKNFRPSASQALQKAFKRGRLLKTGSVYQINPNWEGLHEGRKPTRRPQVGRDHPMVTSGLNGEVLAVSPHKDSQAYRNVADSRLKMSSKGIRPGPRPYGQPGADPLPNPASSIFQNGSKASIILDYQRHTGQKLDADSIKRLYQHMRTGPSNATPDETLANLLSQTGYADAAAAVTATSTETSMSSRPAGSGIAAPSVRRPMPTAQRLPAPMANVARGPTSVPLPSTGEPTMMQQLARMLNDISSPIDPALANSLLGQLSSNAAASAAQAANAQRAGSNFGAGSSSSDLLASAMTAVSGQAPQQDLDSAVSETLAAALQQIGATSTTASAGSQPPPTSAIESVSKAADSTVAPPTNAETGEGIDLTDYQDAIRALTSAFGAEDEDGDENDESDEEADERAIAAAEADPVSDKPDPPAASSEAVSTTVEPASTLKATTDEPLTASTADPSSEANKADESGNDAQMDLSTVLRQLTASLQTQEEPTGSANGNIVTQSNDESAAADTPAQGNTEEMDADLGNPDTANAATTTSGASEEATLQSQLEALVASLAANASGDDDDEDDEDDDDDSDEDEAAS